MTRRHGGSAAANDGATLGPELEAEPGGPATGSRTVRNASLLTVATIAARLLGFGLGVAMARALGIEDYGRYGLALALATVLAPLADLGLHQYLSREAARDSARAEGLLRPIVRAKAAFTATVFGLGALVAVVVVRDGNLLAAILLVLLAGLLDGVSQLVYAYLQGREQMGFEAKATTAAAFARGGGGIALALLTGSLGAVLAWILGVSVVQAGWALRRFAAPLRARRARDAVPGISWRTVLGMGVITVSVMFYLRADTVVIGLLLDERAVGLYTAGYTVMLGLQILPWMVGVALTPVFARTWASERSLFRASWSQGVRAVLLLSLPLSLTVSLLAEPIVERLFGAEFESAGTALAVLVWASPLAGLNTLAAGVLRGAGMERWLSATSVAAAIVNVTASVIAIELVGIVGAAAVTVATEVGLVITLASVALARGLVPRPTLPFGRLLLALALLAAATQAARIVPFELAAVAALALYGLALVGTGAVDRDDLAVLRRQ